jgi:hypothetical protein
MELESAVSEVETLGRLLSGSLRLVQIRLSYAREWVINATVLTLS